MSTRFATIETSRGTIVAELFARDCPGVTEHFERLANAGRYDGVRFHDVDGGRTAHTGDLSSRSASPGDAREHASAPEDRIPGEIVGNRNTHERGALSLEHDDEGMGGSRFFFVLDGRSASTLDGKHTVFGMVESGLDVLARVEPNDVVHSIRVWE